MSVYTLFGQPTVSATNNSGAYTLGMQFSLSSAASLTGIWFYSPAGAASLPTSCAIYNVSTGAIVAGTQLTSPTWSGAAGSGWVKATYSGVALSASTNYVVVVCSGNAGVWWAYSTSYWTTGGAGASGLTSGVISAPNNASAVHGQDVYNSGGTMALPTSTYQSSNYWVDVEVTTGTQYTNPLAGALSFGGSLSSLKVIPITLSAALNFVGNIARVIDKHTNANLNLSGALGTVLTIISGALTFVGNLATTYIPAGISKSLNASLGFTGVLGRGTEKGLSASLSVIGTLSRRSFRTLVANLSIAGGLSRQTIIGTMSAAFNFAGGFNKVPHKNVEALLSSTGVLERAIRIPLVASLDLIGGVVKHIPRSLNGNLPLVGSIIKNTYKGISTGLSFTGVVTTSKAYLKDLTAALGLSGALIKHTSYSVVAVLGVTGSAFTRQIAVPFTASLSFIGGFFRQFKQAVARFTKLTLAPHSPISLMLSIRAVVSTRIMLSSLSMKLEQKSPITIKVITKSVGALRSPSSGIVNIELTIPAPIDINIIG